MDAASARMMVRYKQWSDKVMFDAVAALPEGEAVKPRTSLFKNMVHTLNHIYVIDRIWQAHLEGRDHGYEARNTKDHPPLAEMGRLQQEADAWYVQWADAQTDASLDATVEYTLIGGNRGAMTRGEILLHVVMHTNYHRGYVAEMFYAVPGCRPPSMDLPVYMREGRAAV
ncbi:MAG: DinB family protein [Burkholderiales bacterium]|nr:DinB family protein [Burkholderiales bacterium]